MKNNEIQLFPGKVYHIYNHANGSDNLFVNDGNYLFFLKRYKYFIEPIAETFAYCLMPNHLHLMVRIKDENDLQTACRNFQLDKKVTESAIKQIAESSYPEFISKTFGNLFSSYSLSFNRQQNRMGSLFMPNFRRREVYNDFYFTKLIFYIHNNPVHHGFTQNMDDWNFSSYNAFLSDKKTKLLKHEVLNWFGKKEDFLTFHKKEKVDYSFDL